MIKIDMAVAQDLDGINHIRSEVNADPISSHELGDVGLEDIEQSENSVTFVASDNDQIIGYLSLHNTTSFQNDDDATLEMFVHPDRQGEGIGTALLERIFQYASKNTKLKRLILGVLNDNPSARKLYVRKGIGSIRVSQQI